MGRAVVEAVGGRAGDQPPGECGVASADRSDAMSAMSQEDRAALEANLAALDDAALLTRCVTEIREYRRYRQDDLLYEVCMVCLQECQRRGKPELWGQAQEAGGKWRHAL